MRIDSPIIKNLDLLIIEKSVQSQTDGYRSEWTQ